MNPVVSNLAGVIKMKKEVQVDPVFKLFAFGSKSAHFFETFAVHPEGYLYLDPILSENCLTLNHAASSRSNQI